MKQIVEIEVSENKAYLIFDMKDEEGHNCFMLDLDKSDVKRFLNKYKCKETTSTMGAHYKRYTAIGINKDIRREIPGNAAVQPGTVAGG
jgi:hypothetical protein